MLTNKALAVIKVTAAVAGVSLIARTISRKVSEYDLRHKTVLITGGSRGLGLVLARQFTREGAQVVICARDKEELERAKTDLQKRGGEVLAVKCDITNNSEIADMVSLIHDRFGRIDVLVNNAGVIQVGPLETMTREDFEQAMNTHFWGPV